MHGGAARARASERLSACLRGENKAHGGFRGKCVLISQCRRSACMHLSIWFVSPGHECLPAIACGNGGSCTPCHSCSLFAPQPLPLPFDLARPGSPLSSHPLYNSTSSSDDATDRQALLITGPTSSSSSSASSSGPSAEPTTSGLDPHEAERLLRDSAYWDQLYATFKVDQALLGAAMAGRSTDEGAYGDEDLALAKSAMHTRFDSSAL